MKRIYYISLFLLTAFIVSSCEKHEIEYAGDTPMEENTAEFQLHYFVPVTAGAANYIYKVEVNNTLLTNDAAILNTYNAIPSGAVGRFFTISSGAVNIKLYRSSGLDLVYDQNVTLSKGKQNVFVHDYNQPPVVFDNGYPYSVNDHLYNTDTVQWVKFYNFMYESAGNPTTAKLQYQYYYTYHPHWTLEDKEKGLIPPGKNVGDLLTDAEAIALHGTKNSPWLNLGEPVGFGETTGWIVVPVKKTTFNGSGSARIDYRVIDVANPGTAVNTDYWTGYVGRRYHHVFGGMRAIAPKAAVYVFGAL